MKTSGIHGMRLDLVESYGGSLVPHKLGKED